MLLDEWLEKNGVSRAQFAKKAKVTIGAVNHWCLGRRVPMARYAAKISRLTKGGVSASDLEKANARWKASNAS